MTDAARKAVLASRWASVGACTRCGLFMQTKRFRRCLPCRRKHARWALAFYHRRKAVSA